MSRLFPHQPIANFGAALFCALVSRREEAAVAAGELVQSSLMGHDSHGVLRIPEYLRFLEDGSLKPRAAIEVHRSGRGTASVDCGYGFGAVGGQRAMEVAI